MAIRKPDLSLSIQAELDQISVNSVSRKMLSSLQRDVVARLASVTTGSIAVAQTDIQNHLNDIVSTTKGSSQRIATIIRDSFATGFTGAISSVEQLKKETFSMSKEVTGNMERMSDVTQQGSNAFMNFGKNVLITAGIIGVTIRAVQMLGGLAKGAYGLAKAAAEVADSEKGFRALANQTTNASLALLQIKKSAGGVIDNFTLMTSATRAAIAGLSPAQFAEIVEKSRALSSILGVDVTQGVDDLTKAITKQERKILDNLGIVAEASDLYEDYKISMDITNRELTRGEKLQAFFNETMKAVNKTMEATGGILEDTQRPFLEFNEAAREAGLSLGEAIRKSDIFQISLSGMTRLLKAFGNFFSDDEKKIVSMFAQLEEFKKRSQDITLSQQERAQYALAVSILEPQARAKTTIAIQEEQKELQKLTKDYHQLATATHTSQMSSQGFVKVHEPLTNLLAKALLNVIGLNSSLGTYKITAQQAATALGALTQKQEDANERIESYNQLLSDTTEKQKDTIITASQLAEAVQGAIAETKDIAVFLPRGATQEEQIQTTIAGIDAQRKAAEATILESKKANDIQIRGLLSFYALLAQATAKGDTVHAEGLQRVIKNRLQLLGMNEETYEALAKLDQDRAKAEEQLEDERMRLAKERMDERLANVAQAGESELRIKSDVAKDELAIMIEFAGQVKGIDREIAAKRVEIYRLMVEETNRLFEDAAKGQRRRESILVKGAKSAFDSQLDRTKEALIINANATETEKQRIREEGLSRVHETRQRLMREANAIDADSETRQAIAEAAKNAELNLMGQIERANSSLQDKITSAHKETADAILRISESTSEKEITNAWRVTQEKLLARRAELKEGTPEYQEITGQLESLAIQSEGRIRTARMLSATKTYSDIQGISSLSGIRNMREELARRKAAGENISQFEQALRNRNRAVIGAESRAFNEKTTKDEKEASEKLQDAINGIRIKAEKNRFDKEEERIEQQAADAIALAGHRQDQINRITELKEIALAENEINRKISNEKLFLSIRRIGIEDSLSLRKQQALEEKQLRDQQIEDEITDDVLMYETKIENERAYQRQVGLIELEAFKERFQHYEEFAQVAISSYATISQAVGIHNKRTTDSLSKAINTVSTTLSAFAEGGPLGAITGGLTLATGLVDILSQSSQEATEKIRQNQENLSRFMENMRDQAVQVGQQIGDALSGGFDLDFDKILQGFIKTQVAAGIAEQYGTLLKKPLKELRDSILAQQLGPEAFNRLFPEEINVTIDRMQESMNRVRELQRIQPRKLTPEQVRAMLGVPDAEDIRAIIQAIAKGENVSEDDMRILASRKVQAEKRGRNAEQIVENLETILDDTEPAMRAYVDAAKRLAGDFSDTNSQLDEIIPTATFRAVTEPQANQMILLLSQQLAYLAQISTNTGVLPNMMNIMNGGRLAAAPVNAGLNANMGLENAQAMDFNMALNQDRQARAAGIPAV